MTRSLALDALRAASIAAVLVCHLEYLAPFSPEALSRLRLLGASGVGAFFALSGYLVGGIALRTLRTGADVPSFWIRRWLRTLPTAAVVAIVAAMADQVSPLSFLAVVTFARNAMQGVDDDPFLMHYWSLGVEEWAYLLLPALLLPVAARGRAVLPYLAAAWLLLAAAHGIAARCLSLSVDLSLHLTWLRLDAILAGVVAVAAAPRLDHAARRRLAWVGASGIVVLHGAHALYPAALVGPAFAAEASLVPLLFALMLPALAAWRPRRPIWAAPVEFVAMRSYALYLVHVPLYQAASAYLAPAVSPLGVIALAVGASYVSAEALHHWVERPALALRDRWAPPSVTLEAPASPQRA